MGRKRKTDRGGRDATINDIHSNRDTILALGEKSIAIGTYQKIEQHIPPEMVNRFMDLGNQLLEKIDQSRDLFPENNISPFSDRYDDICPFLLTPGGESELDVTYPEVRAFEDTTIESIAETLEKFIGKEYPQAMTKEAAKYVIYNHTALLLTDSIGAIEAKDWQEYTMEMAAFSAKFVDEQFYRHTCLVQACGYYHSNELQMALNITQQTLKGISMQNTLYLPLKSIEAAAKAGLGDTRDAEVEYRKLLSMKPTNFEYVYGLAATLASQGRNSEAIEFLRSYNGKITGKEEKMRFNYLLCTCLRESGDTDAALSLLNEIEEIYAEVETPSLKSRMLNLNGQIYLDLYRNSNDKDQKNSLLEKAIPLFEHAIKVAETMVMRGDELDDPTHNLGMVLYSQGKIDEALTKFEAAVNPNAPRNAIASISMQAVCKFLLDDFTGSKKLFQSAITEAKNCYAILQMSEIIQNFNNFFPDVDHSQMLSDFVMDYGDSKIDIPAAIDPIFSMLLNHHLARREQSKIEFWLQYREMKQF